MNIIHARSPYSIVIDEPNQIETKVKLEIWNNRTPVVGYTFSSKVVSNTNRKAIYNINNEIREFLNPIIPNYTVDYSDENFGNWCRIQVTTYSKILNGEFIELNALEFIGVDGYNAYQDGANYLIQDVPYYVMAEPFIFNMPIGATVMPYIDVLFDGGTYFISYENSAFDLQIANSGVQMRRIPLTVGLDNNYYFTIQDEVGDTIYQRYINLICEAKYTPMLLSFIGKKGGWENIWCFKAKEDSLDSKNLDFNTNIGFQNFNPNLGIKQVFNKNGSRNIKVNTGFIEEENNALIEQLFMSERIVLDSLPVILKSKNLTFKNHLKDRNINYSFDFDYNFNIINDVV